MKMLKSILFILALGLQSLAAQASLGPNASGGIPETDFQHDSTAISTILKNTELLWSSKDPGSILSIQAVQGEFDLYVIKTQFCTVKARFERNCVVGSFGLPQCKSGSRIVEQSCSYP